MRWFTMQDSTALFVDSVDKETTVSVLIIDDSSADRLLYRTWLQKHPKRNYRVIEMANALDWHAAFMEHRPAIILLDFNMPGMNGLELLWEMNLSAAKLPPVIVITGAGDEDIKTEAMKMGAYAYVNKNELTPDILDIFVSDALGNR